MPEDSASYFKDFLNRSDSISVHQRKLQLLLSEIFKAVNDLNPAFMTQVYVAKNVPHNV